MSVVLLNFSVSRLVPWEVVIIGLPVRVVHLKVLILILLLLMNMHLRGAMPPYIMNEHSEVRNSNEPVQRSQLMCCKEFVEMINVLIAVPLSQIGHL